MFNIKGIHIRNLKQMETSRGIAFIAPLYYCTEKIGFIENRGDGGATTIHVDDESEYKDTFYKFMNQWFEENDFEYFDKEETFAEHLIAVYEYGEMLTDEEMMELFKML